MDKNLHNIEDLFRKGLEDNEDNPSQKTWDGIEKELDKASVVSIKKKYNFLKKIAFLLTFFLAMLSIYVWINRDNSNPEKNNKVTLKKEVKTKNDGAGLLYGDNKIDLRKSVDSINAGAGNNQNPAKETGHAKIDMDILKKQHHEMQPVLEKTVTSSTTKVISNLPVSKEESKSEKISKPSIPKNLLNYSISEQEKSKENKSNNEGNLQTKPLIENDSDFVENPGNIDLNRMLVPLIPLNSLPVTKVKSLTTGFIEVKKVIDKVTFENRLKAPENTESALYGKGSKPTGNPRFFITGFFSPDMAFYHLKDNDSRNQNGYLSKIEKSENEAFSSTAGVLIEYKLRPNWSLQSGLAFATTNIAIHPEIIYAHNDNSGKIQYCLNTSSGYGYVLPSFSDNPRIGDSLYSYSTSHRLQYLGIPLSVKYSIYKGRFSINIIPGISANFLIKGKINTELEKGNKHETETVNRITGLKKFYIGGMAGIGMDYNVYKSLSVSFSPTLRFALNSINKDVPVKTFPNSLGFSLGLKTKL